MRKVLFAVVCAVLCMALAGCGGRNAGELTLDDFSVYENGRVIEKYTDFEKDFGPLPVVQFLYDFEEREPETYRKIKIGSAASEVAEAYKDIVPKEISQSNTQDITFDEFLSNREKYDSNNEPTDSLDYYVSYGGIVVGDKLLSDAEFYELYMSGESIDFDTCATCIISVKIKADKVCGISIGYSELDSSMYE